MHYLHKILVHIPDVTLFPNDKMDEKELLESIRLYADNKTEDFYQQAFDWRETDSAGRWSHEYPQQVYLAASDVDWFIKELEAVMQIQRGEIDQCFSELKRTVGSNLETIINGIWDQNAYGETNNGFSVMTPYYLQNIACHLYGQYRCDSYFYNTHDYTARLYKSDLEKVRQEPDKWALVMFDYHN